jgi:hypothetical protein
MSSERGEAGEVGLGGHAPAVEEEDRPALAQPEDLRDAAADAELVAARTGVRLG